MNEGLVDVKKQKACETELLRTIKFIQDNNQNGFVYGAVTKDQIAHALITSAFVDIEGLGFEIFASGGIDMKEGKPEQGSERYEIVSDKVLKVAQRYLDSLVEKGALIPEEIAHLNDGNVLMHYWVNPKA